MDEQKHIVMIPVPVMSKERFAEMTGLSEGQVRGMIEKGHLPSMKCGKARMVNIARLSQEAINLEDWTA
ncbi:DNA-binding protein [uncultured Halovibrio sp.]|uniref:DNA-binding protein n=1 Tax=uncultured Halovibrio sp. TaxID=985049 RepID=UPI0025E9FDE7|nr:DNA-binding protein [uncultured Halovibrio sp.]